VFSFFECDTRTGILAGATGLDPRPSAWLVGNVIRCASLALVEYGCCWSGFLQLGHFILGRGN
jgi:hypothetical protein